MEDEKDEADRSQAKGLTESFTRTFGTIAAILAFAVAIGGFFYLVDWRVRSVVEGEEFIKKIASHVRPYVIFDHEGRIIHDGGAMQYLLPVENNPIEVQKTIVGSEQSFDLRIDVKPNQHLTTAPLLEVLSSHMGGITYRRGEGYEWICEFKVAGSSGGDEVVLLRLEILK